MLQGKKNQRKVQNLFDYAKSSVCKLFKTESIFARQVNFKR